MEKILRAFNGKRKDLNKNQALNWSTYSLVSCPELTPDTLESWLALPDEVKNDPSLEQIRRKVEEIDYPLEVSGDRIQVQLSGPFYSEQEERIYDSNLTSFLMIWIVCYEGGFTEVYET
ncbi:hypothetical protein KGM_202965 [Danaus plexippus plexippus]|uniref:Uncharacterized protein n=1 Tax=Danaus plexippus plexippus TaxID=278856 RepID=A0A212EU06_DANPL|nr:hypothetical protein KGM_202965 [Danaus plexippus plexippus]